MTDEREQPQPQPRRTRTRAEERIDALDEMAASRAATGPKPTRQGANDERLAELERELAQARQEAGENKAGWQRAAADFSNYRRRTEQERAASLGLASDMLLLKVLALADDLDRALAAMPAELQGSGWVDGIQAIDRKLRLLLESEGVTPIEARGRPFDPREHEAVAQQETTEAPDQTVIDELQRGYRIRDRVLRPALVSVANNPGRQG
jgi:molecular chaperone GrpE